MIPVPPPVWVAGTIDICGKRKALQSDTSWFPDPGSTITYMRDLEQGCLQASVCSSITQALAGVKELTQVKVFAEI